MKFTSLTLIVFSFVFFNCENLQKKPKSESENSTEKVLTSDAKNNELKIEASRLRAGGSIKKIELNGDKANITYVSNFEEYKKLNPQSSLTEDDLNVYWESGDAIEKALIDGSVKIMKKLNFVNEVRIELPYKENIYNISVSKTELEKFTGKDFETITSNWNELFSNPYVYNKKGRDTFFAKFGSKR